MIVVDAHQDIAWVQAAFRRDYRISAMRHRILEEGTGTHRAMIGLPDSLLGRVAVVFGTLFAAPARAGSLGTPYPDPRYSDEREAYRVGSEQLDAYERLADESNHLRLIRTLADLDAVLATWDDDDLTQRQQGIVILMEGADPIIEPRQFEEWYERGVRIVGTSWSMTRYAGGTGAPGKLTSLGHELLEQMMTYNAILDLSHMAESAYYEALDRYEGVVIASHSNPRHFRDSDRHLSDDMIRILAERDGVMGIVPYNSFLSQTWRRGDPPLPLSVVADAIDHVCQVTGSAAHVGIGSDFDGGFGAEHTPYLLETSGDLYRIADVLRGRGYADDAIDAVMSGNFLRKLRQALPAG